MPDVKDYYRVDNEYLDEESGFYCIKVWKTPDADDKGVTVAYVHATTGDYIITDPDARKSGKVIASVHSLCDRIKKVYTAPIPGNYGVVKMAVEGRYEAYVPVDTVENMINKAREMYEDANFGELSEIEMKVVYVCDENDDFLYEA